MMMSRYCCLASLTTLFVLSPLLINEKAWGEESVQIEQIAGESFTAVIGSIDAEGNIDVGQADPLSLRDVRHILRSGQDVQRKKDRPLRVLLSDGSSLWASHLTCQDDVVQFNWEYGTLKIPLEAVRAVQWKTTSDEKQFQAALDQKESQSDTFFVTVGEHLQEINGYLESITDQEMTFQWQDDTHTIPIEEVHGFVLAQLSDPPDSLGRSRVQLKEGSVVIGGQLRLSDGKLKLRLAGDAEVEFPWADVLRLVVFSNRMRFLSDMKPTREVQETIVTLERPWQRDKSVEGNPLSIQGKKFEKGIGVQSRSSLTFDAEASYGRLIAHIGIDDETKGLGDCEFVIRGDGQELYRQRVQGGEAARLIRVDIKGVREVTLIVEPGKELDMADHADWCDVRLIRDR